MENIRADKPCCIPYEADRSWCRGCVQSIDDAAQSADILFVDFRNMESVKFPRRGGRRTPRRPAPRPPVLAVATHPGAGGTPQGSSFFRSGNQQQEGGGPLPTSAGCATRRESCSSVFVHVQG